MTSVTAEAKHIAKMARPIDAMPDDPTQVVTADTPARRADAGMAWGTLIHGLLEHAMRHKDASREDLRRLAGWLTVEEPQLRAVIDEALDTVERAARADFWSVAQSHVHAVETPFLVADGGRLTNGVIDLLFDSDAGWQVVDYKTDRSLEEGTVRRAARGIPGCAAEGRVLRCRCLRRQCQDGAGMSRGYVLSSSEGGGPDSEPAVVKAVASIG